MRIASWMFALCLLSLLALVGCASEQDHGKMSMKAGDCDCCAPGAVAKSPTTLPAHAECRVCKANADLACIDVKVDKNTPSTDYNGKTYYFCSEDCRKAFAKEPGKYAK